MHDLGLLTEDEAQPILREREERRVCVVYRPKADGSIRFRNPASLALVASVLAACNAPSAGPDPSNVIASASASAVASIAEPIPVAAANVGVSDAAATDRLASILDAGAGDAPPTALHGKDAAACSPLAHTTKLAKKTKPHDPAELGGY